MRGLGRNDGVTARVRVRPRVWVGIEDIGEGDSLEKGNEKG